MAETKNSRFLRTIPLVLIIAVLCPFAYGKVIYVDDDATGANDGESWDDAYIHLQDALAYAQTAEKPVEIRVAQGTYKPDLGIGITPGDREATFQLINDVTLTGGYAGLGQPETDPNARDIELYETILSGDLGDDEDGRPVHVPWHAHNRTDNSYHVVTATNVNETSEMADFTIVGGNAAPAVGGNFDYEDRRRRGGGMYMENASPKLTNCTFRTNTALHGAAIYSLSSNPVLTQCSFTQNSAIVTSEDSRIASGTASMGGAMYNASSNPKLTDCNFFSNSAIFEDGGHITHITTRVGGGMYNDQSSPHLLNCTFSGNSALDSGGGMMNVDSNPTIVHCTFTENAAVGQGRGGGMYNVGSDPVIYESVFRENSGNIGAGMYNDDSSPTLITCHFSDNDAFAINNVFGEGGGMYNSGSNPMLIDCTFTRNVASGDGGGGMSNRSESQPILVDCTFNENSAAQSNGGGIFNADSSPSLDHCTFIGNFAFISGGGVFNTGSEPVLTDCIFTGNSGHYGAGLANDANSCPALAGCLFSANSASRGGAMHNSDDSKPSIANCMFSGNSADWGGAIYSLWNSNPSIVHCTFTGNWADSAGGAIWRNQDTPGDPATFVNSIVWSNVPPDIPSGSLISFSNIQGGWSGDGNIDAEPIFAYPGYWTDVNDPDIVVEPNYPNAVWFEGDYHLKSQAGRWDPNSQSWVIDDGTSPCIDAGDPMTPIGYEPFPNGDRINMGAYGNTLEASKSPIWLPFPAALHASNPNPADQATGVTQDVVLQWDVGAYALTHDVYFGTTDDPPPFVRNQIEDTFNPELAAGTTYYWRIDEVNSRGKTTGTVWTFTTSSPPKVGRCFTGETVVWVDGALVPISKVGFSQSVDCINGSSVIEEVQEHEGTFTCYDVILDSGNCISVADNHYFMAESGQWISLQNLKAGTRLRTSKGFIRILSVTKRPMPYSGKVYNLKVEGSDRYLVGEDAVIVRDY